MLKAPTKSLENNMAPVFLKKQGTFGEHDFRVRAVQVSPTPSENGADNTDGHKEVSLWHDIPLFVDKEKGIVNYVCEIPKGTRDKFEIDTKDKGNPIRQDLDKQGNLRQYKRGDVFFNYGAMPRTWEDPNHMLDVELEKKVGGDNDPLDVCEIGLRKAHIGEVRQVKVLGVLCMIDDGEADWKVICIDTTDRWAPEINDIADIETHLPGVLDDIRNWWRVYKVAEGKPENKFGFGEKFLDQKYAMHVVNETHQAWVNLAKSVVFERKVSPLYVQLQDSSSIHGDNSAAPSAAPSTCPSDDESQNKKRKIVEMSSQ